MLVCKRSGLVSWLVVLAGVLSAMHVVGVNIQPLLTVGGVSGVIVGLSAQSVMANMISGINLVGIAVSGTYQLSQSSSHTCLHARLAAATRTSAISSML